MLAKGSTDGHPQSGILRSVFKFCRLLRTAIVDTYSFKRTMLMRIFTPFLFFGTPSGTNFQCKIAGLTFT